MPANTALRVTELDFNSIKNNLKTFLKAQTEFADYDFDGSGLSVLLDVLAYNTHYMAFYLNLVANEMFLDTAQLRSSVVSHAKHIDYVPRSRTAAEATVNITVTPSLSEDQSATTLTLPAESQFLSEPIDGIPYIFTNASANTAIKANGAFQFNNVLLKQGIPTTLQYNATGESKYNIPTANVDTTTISVSVQESISNTYLTTYQSYTDITLLDANTAAFFIEEAADGTYDILFGDGVIGIQPSLGNIIIIDYLVTAGQDSNKANNFTNLSAIGTYQANVIVSSLVAAAAGAEKEDIETIRFRAPFFYTTQNRAVTADDYKTLLLKDYPNIEAISVWSGDENIPPVFGKIFISMKPRSGYELSLITKQQIIDEVIANRSILTVFPEIVDPDYTYLLINAMVNYDVSTTSLDEASLAALVTQAIVDYSDADLSSFDSAFRISKLQKAIDNAHNSILGSTASVVAQKRLIITTGQSKTYSVDFKFPLRKGSFDDKFYVYPPFTVLDGAGLPREVHVEDTPNSVSGIDSISVVRSGSAYTQAPTVTIAGDGQGAQAHAVITNGAVTSIVIDDRGTDYTVATATLTSVDGNGSGATATPILQSRIGTLRLFYYRPNGEKVIVNPTAGTIDYNLGTVTLDSINIVSVVENDRYEDDILTFNATPQNQILQPLRNGILTIDDTDSGAIIVAMAAE